LLPVTPRSILVCRANKRLGNILFVTPLIRALADRFPESAIDLLVLDPEHRRLLAGLPGIRDIIQVPRNPARVLAFMLRFRFRRYDLAIDPSVNATTNRLVISLCRAEHKLGVAGPEQWVRPTHAARIPDHEPHQAMQALHLLQEGIPGAGKRASEFLMVCPGDAPRAAAANLLDEALGAPKLGPVVGFFTRATGHKQLPAQWWHQWADFMQYTEGAPRLIQIMPPGSSEQALPRAASTSVPQLERLAALMGLLDLFVAADSGPMHLAAAAGTPTIGLFRATSPRDYAPLGPGCLALGPDQLDPSKVAERTLRHLRCVLRTKQKECTRSKSWQADESRSQLQVPDTIQLPHCV